MGSILCYLVKYKSKNDSTAAITMTDQFSFLGDKRKATIAVAMSLGVLLLLPASFGFGGGTIIMQEAFGQFNLPLLEDEEVTEEEDGEIVVEEEEEETATTTTPTTPTTPAAPTTVQDPSAYLMADRNVDAMRGFIVISKGKGCEKFVTEMNVAAIDGSSFHNITIREGDPHRFEVTEGNGTAAASSSIVGNIFLDGGTTPVIDNVPMTLTIRGQTLAIQGIDIDEARITDTGQRGIISVIDGQTIYGSIAST